MYAYIYIHICISISVYILKGWPSDVYRRAAPVKPSAVPPKAAQTKTKLKAPPFKALSPRMQPSEKPSRSQWCHRNQWLRDSDGCFSQSLLSLQAKQQGASSAALVKAAAKAAARAATAAAASKASPAAAVGPPPAAANTCKLRALT